MKRLILLLLLVAISTVAFAEVDFYGSARMSYFYNMLDEDFSGVKDGRTDMEYGLQNNSRFGAKFNHDMFTGHFEIGAKGNIRLLYATYRMDYGTLLVGQAANMLYDNGSAQVWDGDGMNWGVGSAAGAREQQVKFTTNQGLSIALMKFSGLMKDSSGEYLGDVMMPKIEVGYTFKNENILLASSFTYAMESYNEDVVGFDGNTMAYIFNLRAEYMDEQLGKIKIEGHYGINTMNMGLENYTSTSADWDIVKNEVLNTTDIGCMLAYSKPINETVAVQLGVGYQMADNEDADWEQADTAMSYYLNFPVKVASRVVLTPEFGMLDLMEDQNEVKEGTNMYFGTKLQLDF